MVRPPSALPGALLGLALCGLIACGDNPEKAPEYLLEKLRALDGVTVEMVPTDVWPYSYYVLWFSQPVDHDSPDGPRFVQRVSLLHRDLDAPMIALTSGYWDYYRDTPFELTSLLAANQISIEHRYFGESRPSPPDWSKLTIRQMADDEHRIIAALRTVYPGPFLTTGPSKGGMTATYHRRFYPDDVDGTVPYVAPISFGAPDRRYPEYLNMIGPPSCRMAVREVATEMLARRRPALLARAQVQAAAEGRAYTRVPLGPALEAAVTALEWSFWQYFGVNHCTLVPAVTASDDALWAFLDKISPPSDNDDDGVAQFEAYYYQAQAELGYPDDGSAYLDPFKQYVDADYDGALPTARPAYDGGAAMRDVDAFVRSGARFLFVYGEWDPWSGGKYELGDAVDSLLLVQPQGAHDAHFGRLTDSDRASAFDRLEAWTGVQPGRPQSRAGAGPRGAPGAEGAHTALAGADAAAAGAARGPSEPRLPTAMVRARRF
jgi:hypothetical protein